MERVPLERLPEGFRGGKGHSWGLIFIHSLSPPGHIHCYSNRPSSLSLIPLPGATTAPPPPSPLTLLPANPSQTPSVRASLLLLVSSLATTSSFLSPLPLSSSSRRMADAEKAEEAAPAAAAPAAAAPAAPPAPLRKSKALPMSRWPDTLDDTMAGNVGFDPMGWSGRLGVDGVGIDLYFLREAELKHSRVAMLAVAGFLWVEQFGPAPGCEAATLKSQTDSFWQIWDAHPSYIGAMVFFVSLLEFISGIATTYGKTGVTDRKPGDFGLDPLKLQTPGNEKKFADMQLKEIKNGRLAMWGAAGLLLQGVTTHQGGIEALGGR